MVIRYVFVVFFFFCDIHPSFFYYILYNLIFFNDYSKKKISKTAAYLNRKNMDWHKIEVVVQCALSLKLAVV